MEKLLQRLREKLSSYLKWAEAEIATTEATSSIQDMIDDLDYIKEFLPYYEKHIERRLSK